MPPRLPRKTGNPRMLAVEEAVRAYLEREANLVDRLVKPTPTVNRDYRARPGELVLCNSSNGAFNVYLPPLARDQLGQCVMVVACGDADATTGILTNTVTVRVPDSGVVIAWSTLPPHTSASFSVTTTNLLHIFIAATITKWVVR